MSGGVDQVEVVERVGGVGRVGPVDQDGGFLAALVALEDAAHRVEPQDVEGAAAGAAQPVEEVSEPHHRPTPANSATMARMSASDT